MDVKHEFEIDSFPFKTKPYAHQLQALSGGPRTSWGYLMEMGTGKSKTLLDDIGMRYLDGKIDFAVIFAPKGVYRNWVSKEIPEHFTDAIPHRVIRWVASPNKKQQRELRSISEPFEGMTFFIMNIEALSTVKGKEALTWLGRRFGARGLIAVDESTTIKNHQAKRTKAIVKAGQLFAYRRILTGSPVTKAPMDIYSQAEFLGPRLLGFGSFYAFRARYAVIRRRTMGSHSFDQIVGYQNLEELTEKIRSFSFRIRKDECLDLPDKIYTTREIPLTTEQAKLYAKIQEEGLAELENGEMVSTREVITKMLRLQQVLSGHTKTDEGEVVEIPTNRFTELMAVLEETEGKVIIWSRFRYDIQKMVEMIGKEYGADSVAAYFGDTPDDERAEIVRRFQDVEDPLRFFVGNPSTAGYGITLTAANTCIYVANSFDLEKRIQSEDRAHRLGQKHPVLYIDFITPNSIDERVVQALRDKIDLASLTLGEEARTWLQLKPMT